MKLPPCLGICTTLKASEEGIFTNQIHSTDIGEQTLSRHVSRPEKLDHFCCPNLILLTCKTSYPNRCRRSPLAANHATCFCMISIWFSAQTLFYFFQSFSKARNGNSLSEEAAKNGGSDFGPNTILVHRATNSSVSTLSAPSSGPSNSFHGSTSASTLVVSATAFVRKSSLLRRPKPEVWTVERENSL